VRGGESGPLRAVHSSRHKWPGTFTLRVEDGGRQEQRIDEYRGASLIRKCPPPRAGLCLGPYGGPGEGGGFLRARYPCTCGRPVHLIITMTTWFRTSRLSIKDSLSEYLREAAERAGAVSHLCQSRKVDVRLPG